MKCFAQTVAIISWLVLSNAIPADLLSTDSYLIGPDPTLGEYSEAALNGQPAVLMNQGFSNGGYNQGTGTAQFQATTLTLNSNVGGLGGKVVYSSTPLDGIYRSVARSVDRLPGLGTYYFSQTVNRGDIPQAGGDGFVLSGFGNFVAPELGPTSGFLAGVFVGFSQNPSNPNSFGDLVLRARTTTAQSAEDMVLVDGAFSSTANQTYTVVFRVDIAGGADNVSWWLNPTDFQNGEAGLTATSSGNGSFSSFSFGSASDLQRLNYTARNWNGNVFFDEPRLATEIADLEVAATFILGDINGDGAVNLLDVQPFVTLVVKGIFQAEGDINNDGVVDLLDVQGFVALLVG